MSGLQKKAATTEIIRIVARSFSKEFIRQRLIVTAIELTLKTMKEPKMLAANPKLNSLGMLFLSDSPSYRAGFQDFAGVSHHFA